MAKRILFFAYGTFSYLIFLGTFLYAIGFIGNFGVPSTLDGPASGPFLISFAIDAGLLTLFAVQHSVMARKWFKEWWTRLVPKPIERSTYVLFSSLALIVLFTLWRPLGGVIQLRHCAGWTWLKLPHDGLEREFKFFNRFRRRRVHDACAESSKNLTKTGLGQVELDILRVSGGPPNQQSLH